VLLAGRLLSHPVSNTGWETPCGIRNLAALEGIVRLQIALGRLELTRLDIWPREMCRLVDMRNLRPHRKMRNLLHLLPGIGKTPVAG
jgi:hypothetical protein